MGCPGEAGPTGATGCTGCVGETGDTGPVGATGEALALVETAISNGPWTLGPGSATVDIPLGDDFEPLNGGNLTTLGDAVDFSGTAADATYFMSIDLCLTIDLGTTGTVNLVTSGAGAHPFLASVNIPTIGTTVTLSISFADFILTTDLLTFSLELPDDTTEITASGSLSIICLNS